ncbi:MAG: MFS transporter [Anaerolineales bacterium]|nr:MFS transporter [Anaerolineales bacterium]
MTTLTRKPTGMFAFVIIWLGQIASLLGTAMSQFGLTLWAYESTGKATPLALVGFFFIIPQVALAPFIGVLVDRGNRKLMMMLSDLAAALTTALVLGLYLSGNLQIWHLYITSTITGIFQGFQWPAYSAAISLMLPKEHYARANGMLSMAENASAVFAPLLAGVLIGPLGLVGILLIDLVAAALAIGALLLAHVPQPARTAAGEEAEGSILRQISYGFRYIFSRPSLLGLQLVFMTGNFFAMLAFAVEAPLILARSGNDELVFGSVQSAGAIGGVIGALVMSAWGGPKRRVHGVLGGWMFGGLFGTTLLGLGQSPLVWAAAMFLGSLPNPFINGCNQAIWQSKVAPDVQGRVFTTRMMIAWLVMPVSQLLAGPLSDQVLEPAMAEGGRLAGTFGWLVGVGPGAGMGLIFFFCGLMMFLVGLGGYLFPAVRNAEDLLPDHQALSQDAVAAAN